MNEKAIKALEFDKIIKKLVGFAVSTLGKELCEALVPQKDYEKVSLLLKQTSDAVNYIYRRGYPSLDGICDIRHCLKHVEAGGVLCNKELLNVADVLYVSRRLRSHASEVEHEDSNIVEDLIYKLKPNKAVEDKIKFSIASEDEVADNASQVLSSIRRQIRRLQDSIKDSLNDIIRSPKYQKFIQEAVVTIRGGRYVIPVKQEYRNELPGLVHDSSSSGATLFIEPMAVVELNNSIKQLKIKEQAEIERILRELTAEVKSILDDLHSNVSTLAMLDFIFAKAKMSLEYNCVCPRLNMDGRIIIKKGRHPFLDRNTVVPIDFWIGDGFNTLVITGPNTGGKTVALKTIGLFAMMTQAGLHIPALEGTCMNVFENVFADIGDEQSIEQNLSTFSSHMTNIIKTLESVNANSLVLFDELGAGTDPTEGAALAMSILEYLHQVGAVTVATTHYSELKLYAMSSEGVENACCEFDIATLKPTYRLLIGIPGKSNAFAISRKLGLPDNILERAKSFLTKEDIKFEDILKSIEDNRVESEKQRVMAEKYRIEMENLKREVEEQKRELELQRQNIIRRSREEGQKILLEAQKEAKEILDEMKRLEKEREDLERIKEAEALRAKLKNRFDRLNDLSSEPAIAKYSVLEPPENLMPGDSVLALNFNKEGTVKIPPDKNGNAVVQIGIIEVNVHVSNLKRIEKQKDMLQKTGFGKIGISKSMNVSTEIDLRGYTVDEALDIVDKFLDDACIAGLKDVTIIHGKGTGALRSGIHKFLKTHSHVKSFRLGKYGEGETGVTIVELN